ncbi:hypothetical protein BC835DRAFT_1521807, partial [Cytidiella melzeri]
MAYTIDTTLASLISNGNATSSSRLQMAAEHDLAHVGGFIDAPAVMKGKDTSNPSNLPEAAPSNYTPCLYTLGSTYEVLNGYYADSDSALQQVVDWNKEFGGKDYSIPEIVNFNRKTTSDYSSSYGKTATEYMESLSVNAGFEASYRGFSASAEVDYTESQRASLSHAFTRITYAVTHYNISLPTTQHIKPYLKTDFVSDLDTMDPIELYRAYGTHLLCSLTVGGRAVFLASTDTRSYSSDMSLAAAAKISASYLVASGDIHLSTEQKKAMDSFNESS